MNPVAARGDSLQVRPSRRVIAVKRYDKGRLRSAQQQSLMRKQPWPWVFGPAMGGAEPFDNDFGNVCSELSAEIESR